MVNKIYLQEILKDITAYWKKKLQILWIASSSNLTFMKSMTCKSFKFSKVVHKVAVLIFGVWCHVMKLTDISLPDAQGEDLYTTPAQHCCYWPRIPAVRVAVCDEEDDLCGIQTWVPQNLLQKCASVNTSLWTKNKTTQYFSFLCTNIKALISV